MFMELGISAWLEGGGLGEPVSRSPDFYFFGLVAMVTGEFLSRGQCR